MLRLLDNRHGAVRALLALVVVGVSLGVLSAAGLYLLVTGKAETGIGLMGVIGSALGAVTGFYFGQRGAAREQD